MKLLRFLYVSLVIVLGYLTIVACGSGDIPMYWDNDKDGYGDTTVVCGSVESEYGSCVADNTDCNDFDPAINPAAVEIVDSGADENCDGFIGGTRFSVMGDGTVRDEDSGLIWFRDADVFMPMDWSWAMDIVSRICDGSPAFLSDSSTEGDWRLPTKGEWEAFVDQSYTDPALSNGAGTGQWVEGDLFTGVYSRDYWSSTEEGPDIAWEVSMLDGNLFNDLKEDGSFYVWPVRTAYVDSDGDGYGSQVVCTGQPVCVPDNTDCDDRPHGADMFPGNADDGANIYPSAVEILGNDVDENCDGIIAGTRFTDMGDGTVTDEKSGLIWLKDANCSELAGIVNIIFGTTDWNTANTVAAAGLSAGTCGLTDGSIPGDWRLPTKEEWQAFVDKNYESPALSNGDANGQWTEGNPFNGVQNDGYWSSTQFEELLITAWHVSMTYGTVHNINIVSDGNVWPVR